MSEPERGLNYIILEDEFNAQREQNQTEKVRSLMENWYKDSIDIRDRKRLNLSQILGQK